MNDGQLELPANPSKKEPVQFDYDTISDVILHIRYTGREGGGLLRKGAVDNLKAAIDAAQAAGSVRLFSVRHEFSTEWAKFQNRTPAADERFELAINPQDEHYPFWSQGRLNSVVRVDVLARSTQDAPPGSVDIFEYADRNNSAKKGTLSKDATLGNLLRGQLTTGLPAKPNSEIKLFFDTKEMADLWIAVTWSSSA